jgi:uncharacterized glyoxalase superfamily protein PhnB
MEASSAPGKTVRPGLVYDDAHSAIRFLAEAFGFERRLLVPGVEEGRSPTPS